MVGHKRTLRHDEFSLGSDPTTYTYRLTLREIGVLVHHLRQCHSFVNRTDPNDDFIDNFVLEIPVSLTLDADSHDYVSLALNTPGSSNLEYTPYHDNVTRSTRDITTDLTTTELRKTLDL